MIGKHMIGTGSKTSLNSGKTYVSEIKCQIRGLLNKSQLQVLGQEAALEHEVNIKVNITGETDASENCHQMRSFHVTNTRRHFVGQTSSSLVTRHSDITQTPHITLWTPNLH